jgi:hypothetical protein
MLQRNLLWVGGLLLALVVATPARADEPAAKDTDGVAATQTEEPSSEAASSEPDPPKKKKKKKKKRIVIVEEPEREVTGEERRYTNAYLNEMHEDIQEDKPRKNVGLLAGGAVVLALGLAAFPTALGLHIHAIQQSSAQEFRWDMAALGTTIGGVVLTIPGAIMVHIGRKRVYADGYRPIASIPSLGLSGTGGSLTWDF